MGCGSSHHPVVASTGSKHPHDNSNHDLNNFQDRHQPDDDATDDTDGYTAVDSDIEITLQECAALNPKTPDAMWTIVQKSSVSKEFVPNSVKNRRGWKTIRLFVSSTFRDFHAEREVLVKEVFPDLRIWCEKRKLHLVECDLRWGVPKDTTTEETVRICLGELDRCYEDNAMPFFLNLTCNRCGWIPTFGDLTYNLAIQYGWVYGLSLTEMEIVHGAFRTCNPNALFLIRDETFTERLTDEIREAFVDEDPLYAEKLKKLKQMLQNRFPTERVVQYAVDCEVNQHKVIDERDVQLKGLSGSESTFYKSVFNFFKERIEDQYPLDPTPEDPLEAQRTAHESFLDSRSQVVLGRDAILQELLSYSEQKSTKTRTGPLLLVGKAGAGKSAIMAKIANDAIKKHNSNRRVFFHFVGAAPGSTDLAFFLQRIINELAKHKEVISDLDSLVTMTNSILSKEDTPPTLLVVDAINQMDDDKLMYLNRWLPEYLSPNVKVILSMIDGTECHYMLRKFKSCPKEVICGDLDSTARQAIVENILSQYNKKLDGAQMDVLLSKKGSANPLWLSLACEELRVYGNFNKLDEKITSLSDDLIELEEQVLSRFEKENGGNIVIATCCLLETSRHGLLETEILQLLADETTLVPPVFQDGDADLPEMLEEGVDKDDHQIADRLHDVVDNTYVQKGDDEVDEVTDGLEGVHIDNEMLVQKKNEEELNSTKPQGLESINKKPKIFVPAAKWASVYRALKPLLRPCGDLGEGRLDFYHRSISKAVRRKYFSGSNEFIKAQYTFWHGKLASFFEDVDDMDRKSEELPYHLEQLLDNNRLISCLLEWPVFERLFNPDFSVDLLRSWQKAGGYSPAANYYKESLKVLQETDLPREEFAMKKNKVAAFLLQAGQYSDAYELLEELLKMEEEEFKRPSKIAYIYQLLAKTRSEILKANHYKVSKAQLVHDRAVVEFSRKSIEYYKQVQQTEETQQSMAQTKILLAHHLRNIANLERSEEKGRSEAHIVIDEAIETFYKLSDMGHASEATMIKSFIYENTSSNFDKKLELLTQSFDLCLKTYGEKHMLSLRHLINIGILYENASDYEKSYDYFDKWQKSCLEVLGPNHPKSVRAKTLLAESRYDRIRKQREKQSAGTA